MKWYRILRVGDKSCFMILYKKNISINKVLQMTSDVLIKQAIGPNDVAHCDIM